MLQQVSRREGRMRGNHATGACGRQQLTTGHWHSSLQQQQSTPVAGFGNLKQSQRKGRGPCRVWKGDRLGQGFRGLALPPSRSRLQYCF